MAAAPMQTVGRRVVLLRVKVSDHLGKGANARPFCHSDSGVIWYTGSGIVVDEEEELFCTTGYFLAPFLDPDGSLPSDITIEVIRKEDDFTWRQIELLGITKIDSVTKCIRRLTSSSPSWRVGWLLEDGESRIERLTSQLPQKEESLSYSSEFFKGLTCPSLEIISESGIDKIAFFTLKESSNRTTSMLRMEGERNLSLGHSVFAVGTPFGVNSPEIFYNSVSKGIISNYIAADESKTDEEEARGLWLIDARISPGVEGGGLCTPEGKVVGMLLPPVRRVDDVVAFNIAIPIQTIISNCFQLNKSIRNTKIEDKCFLTMDETSESIDKAKRSLVLLKCGTIWTSGFFISAQGHILTNAHLFGSKRRGIQAEVRVRMHDSTRGFTWKKARVLFVSTSCFDVALLQLTTTEEIVACTVYNLPLQAGKEAVAIGYSVWGSQHKFSPSATKGVVSRVVKLHGKEAMLLTDVAIQKGNSGGMIIDATTGQVIGMAAFNGMIKKPGAENTFTLPRLNFSIPISFLSPFFEYCNSRQESLLEPFNSPSPEYIRLWRLDLGSIPMNIPPTPPQYTKYLENIPQIKSKL